MSNSKKQNKRLVKDLLKLAALIERVDPKLKIVHASVAKPEAAAKPNKRA